MSHLRLVYSASPVAPPPEWRLTSRDLMALTQWVQRGDAHGYRRVLIEAGAEGGSPEDGGYALIYSPDRDWARWGVRPCAGGIAIWHCGTGADLGRFPTMSLALESLPPVWGADPARAGFGALMAVAGSRECAASREA